MYKVFCAAAVVLAVLTVSAGTIPADPNHRIESQVVVKKLALQGQTQPIPSTTLFTPKITGLYRLSTYMAMTTAGPPNSLWSFNVGWTDDTGLEGPQTVLQVVDTQTPPNAYGYGPVSNLDQTFIIRAIAGTPVTYSVTGSSDTGTYEVFATVEQLP